MECLLGIDLGVSFIKIGLYDSTLNCLAKVQKKSPGRHDGREIFIQKADDYFKLIIEAIRELVEENRNEADRINAITVSGQMAAVIGIDSDWNDITTCSNNMDTRYIPYVEKMIELNHENMARISGTNFPYWGAKLVWWKNDFPDLYRKVNKFIFLAGYIEGKLCGLKAKDAFTDPTYLEMTGIADTEHRKWSHELCSSFGIDTDKLPEIVNSYSIVGALTKANAELCGLSEGVPVVAGAGDKPAGAFGAGLVEPGVLIDESASFGALSLCTDKYVPDTEFGVLEIIPSPINGLFYPTSFLLGSGVTISWFFKTFLGVDNPTKDDFADIERKISKIPPGSENLISIGLLDGRAYPCEPEVRGLWMGHSWHHTSAHFYKALLESYGFEFEMFSRVMKKLYGIDFKEVIAIGGGAKSEIWNNIKSDILGLPYITTDRDDHALIGDAIIGGYAVGIFSDMQESARNFSKKVNRFAVDKTNNELYKKFITVYHKTVTANREVFKVLRNI